MRNFIGRDHLYDEEYYNKEGLSQQVCITVNYKHKHHELYEVERQNGLIISTNLIGKDIVSTKSGNIIFYVRDEELALELAKRWIKEEKSKRKEYTLRGVDSTFSVFD